MRTSSTSPSGSDQKKRKRRCVNESKAHRSQEKKRRQLINGSISRLRDLVPTCEGQRHTIINVLHATEDYVRDLKDHQAALEAEIARLRAANSAPLVAPFPAQAPPLPAVTEALSPAHIPLPVPIPEPVYYAEPEKDVRSRTSSPAYAYSHSQSHSPSPEAVVLPSAVHPAHHVAQTAPAPEEVRAAVLKACSRAPLFTRPAPPVDIVPLPLSVATMTPFPVPPSPPALLGFSSLSSDPFFTLM